jgi:hypothetical protein
VAGFVKASQVLTDELIGGSLGWVRLIAIRILDRRQLVPRKPVKVGFAGGMVNHRAFARFGTSFLP